MQTNISYTKKFKLQIGLSTGLMSEDSLWKSTHIAANVSIEINDTVLYQGPISNSNSNFEFDVLDSSTIINQVLKIKLLSISSPSEAGANPMLKIDHVWIEDLCMRKTLEDSGICIFYQRPSEVNIPSEHMGEPGEQILKFSTPIYPWLLANEKYFNYYYKQ